MLPAQAAQLMGGWSYLQEGIDDGTVREGWSTPPGYEKPIKMVYLPQSMASIVTGWDSKGEFKASKKTTKAFVFTNTSTCFDIYASRHIFFWICVMLLF